MAGRRTIGDNPLDALIPRPPADAGAEETDVEAAMTAGPTAAKAPAETPAGSDRSSPVETSGAAEAAAPQATAEVARETPGQCLTFFLAGEEYAVAILRIREIVEYEVLTRVPMTPPWIRGVMNLRGTVVPVVDVAVKFGLQETAITARTCIVIVEVDLDGESSPLGVMVDAIGRVLDLAPEAVEEPPAFGTRVRVDFLLGVAKVEDELVLLLDLDRVLSTDELLAAAAAPAMVPDEAQPDPAAEPEAAAGPRPDEDHGSASPAEEDPAAEATASGS